VTSCANGAVAPLATRDIPSSRVAYDAGLVAEEFSVSGAVICFDIDLVILDDDRRATESEKGDGLLDSRSLW
jgi:hypothetical protein